MPSEDEATGNYRYATKVRVTPSLDGHDGVWMFAGKIEDGTEMIRESDGEQEQVTVEVIERFHADERMTEKEAVEFGKQQDDKDWNNDE